MNHVAEYLGVESNLEWNEMLFFLTMFASAGMMALILYAGGWL